MTPADLLIREMTSADHIVVGEIGFAAWKSSDALDGSYLDPDVIRRVHRAYLDFPAEAEGKVHVAELDGRVAGWAARDGAPNYISDVWVDPAFQGRGVGGALVRFLLGAIRREDHNVATIQTHARNEGAIRLYQRCGFAIVWRGLEYSKSMGVELEKVHLELAFENGEMRP